MHLLWRLHPDVMVVVEMNRLGRRWRIIMRQLGVPVPTVITKFPLDTIFCEATRAMMSVRILFLGRRRTYSRNVFQALSLSGFSLTHIVGAVGDVTAIASFLFSSLERFSKFSKKNYLEHKILLNLNHPNFQKQIFHPGFLCMQKYLLISPLNISRVYLEFWTGFFLPFSIDLIIQAIHCPLCVLFPF